MAAVTEHGLRPMLPAIDDFEGAAAVITLRLSEKLPLPHESAILLSSVIRPTFPTFDQSLKSCCPFNTHATKRFQAQVPILTSEHELDAAQFRQSSLEKLNINLPLEALDLDNDEGLVFPESFWASADEVKYSATDARLDATKEIVQLLQDVRRLGCHPRDDSLWEASRMTAAQDLSSLHGLRKRAARSLTPPLLSRPSSPKDYIPASPALRVPVVSQPSTPSDPQYGQVQRLLAEEGTALPIGSPQTNGVSQEECIQRCLLRGPSSAGVIRSDQVQCRSQESPLPKTRLNRKRRSAILKVETPLTPPHTVKKRKPSNNAREELDDIMADITPGVMTTIGACVATSNKEGLEAELALFTRSALEQVEAELQSETLRNVPPDLKLRVPPVTSISMVPPWENDRNVPMNDRTLMSTILRGVNCVAVHSNAEDDICLDWNWLRTDLHCKIEEQITYESWREWLMDVPEDGLTDYAPILYKSKGIGLLTSANNVYDTENRLRDDLTKQVSTPMQPLGSPSEGTNSRSRRSTHSQSRSFCAEAAALPSDQSSRSPAVIISKKPVISRWRQAMAREVPSFEFSAGASLADFMALRGRKSLDLTAAKPHGTTTTLSDGTDPLTLPLKNSPPGPVETSVSAADAAVAVPDPEMPMFPLPRLPLTLILSASLLESHRQLVRELETHSQPRHLLFRDYGADAMQLPAHLANLAPVLQEADVILSPQTAVVLASIEETMQKYLPGQARRAKCVPICTAMAPDSPLQTRIAMVAGKYEELYVLVCHTPSQAAISGTAQSSGVTHENALGVSVTLDERCSKAITSFSTFCAALAPNAAVKSVLVSPASASVVASWIVALANYAHRDMPWSVGQEVPLTSNNREVFLRSAGLNAFAALQVLRWDPQNVAIASRCPTDIGTEFGNAGLGAIERKEAVRLSEFVNISPIERRRRYGTVLGPRMLRRVEKAFEMEW